MGENNEPGSSAGFALFVVMILMVLIIAWNAVG